MFVLFILLSSGVINPVFSYEDFYQSIGQEQADHNGEIDHKCGLPIMLQISNPGNLEYYEKYKFYKSNQEKLDSIYISPSGHFRIQYEVGGIDAIPDYDRNGNGTPDYLEFVAKSFDRAWEIEIDSLGFKPPPDINGNPRSVYPIECRRLSVYGSTFWDPGTDEIASLPGLNYVSTIEINTNYSFVNYPHARDDIARDSMAIAVTAAHEFNHALQIGYRLWPNNQGFFEDIWFIESSAVYMEEVVADEVNDYIYGAVNYIKAYIEKTDQPLDESNNLNVDYGKVALEILLGKRYGRDITRRVWEEIVKMRAEPALENVLLNSGTNIFTELTQLSLWFYFTGVRSINGEFFPDAAIFPELNFKPANPVQAVPNKLIEDSLPRLSFQWYISEVRTTGTYVFILKSQKETGLEQLKSIFVNPGKNEYSINQATELFALIDLVAPMEIRYSVVNGNNSGEDFFPFIISYRTMQVTQQSRIHIGPQPLKLSSGQKFLNFKHIPQGSDIFIFSINGRHLQTLHVTSNAAIYSWDLRTKFGDKLGSGVYIYRLKSDKQEYTGKFAIIN